MQIKRKQHKRSFLDLLFNVLVFLSVLLLLHMIVNSANLKTKAEYTITVLWELNDPNDVDTWLEDPAGNKVWYSQKEKRNRS